MLTHANRQRRSATRSGEASIPHGQLKHRQAQPSTQLQHSFGNQATQRQLLAQQTANAPPPSPSVVQRQATASAANAGKTHQLRDSYVDCNESPHDEKVLKQAVRTAFERVRDDECIQNEALRADLLAAYDGIKIVCSQDAPEEHCAERIDNHAIRFYKTAYMTSKCPAELAATIFHESVHLPQSGFESHGYLSFDCQEACFPGSDVPHRGKASGCKFERGALRFLNLSFGAAFAGNLKPTRYLRVFYGYEKRRWLASYLDFAAGVAVSYIGETESGQPGEISGSSELVNLMAALRLDPGDMGGLYGSISAGAGLATSGSNQELGAEVGVGVGMRWRVFDVSVNVGLDFDPTRKAGMDKVFTAAATLTLTPGVKR